MKVLPTSLPGLVVIEFPVHRDARGAFQRLHCRDTFVRAGLPHDFPQSSLATNGAKGILRGMHFQRATHQEDKLVRCVGGRILDVAVDIRPDSPTFKQHYAIELAPDNARALFVPKGFAHGYLTLEDGAIVLYHVTTPYAPGSEGGLRWNDPAIGIHWPIEQPQLSDKDAAWPDFDLQAVA